MGVLLRCSCRTPYSGPCLSERYMKNRVFKLINTVKSRHEEGLWLVSTLLQSGCGQKHVGILLTGRMRNIQTSQQRAAQNSQWYRLACGQGHVALVRVALPQGAHGRWTVAAHGQVLGEGHRWVLGGAQGRRCLWDAHFGKGGVGHQVQLK